VARQVTLLNARIAAGNFKSTHSPGAVIPKNGVFEVLSLTAPEPDQCFTRLCLFQLMTTEKNVEFGFEGKSG